MSASPGDETFTLGTLTLTKGEYANAEKINEIIDYLNEKENTELIKTTWTGTTGSTS